MAMSHIGRRLCACAVGAGICLGAQPARAQSAAAPQADIQQIRQEIEQLHAQFAAIQERLAALEAKLPPQPAPAPALPTEPAQPPTPPAQPPPATPPAGTEVTVPAGAAGAGGPQGALPVYGNASALSKIFNPDIAAIGNFEGAIGRNTIAPAPAMTLDEAELSFQSIVDPYARADFFLSASPEGIDVEEGFITFPTLPGGLLAKVGKMRPQFGKANTMHDHVLPWVDMPLVVQNLLQAEEGFIDSGISVSKLILNPVLFLEATGEVYRGQNELFTSHKRGNLAYVGRLRGYRDITESTNFDFGTSIAFGHNDVSPDSTTRVVGIDATFRYRPLRRAIYKRFIGRTELMWSRRGEELGDVRSFGMYGSAEYQFARRWFAGARYDWSERASDASLTDKGPSLLFTYWPSEFSQVRGQFRRTRYGEGVTSNEVLFQFLFSIGAHGAHVF